MNVDQGTLNGCRLILSITAGVLEDGDCLAENLASLVVVLKF